MIRGNETQLVIDCGSTKRHLADSFQQIRIDYRQTDALLLTHAHSDHTSQLKMFSRSLVYSPFPVPDFHWQAVIPFEPFVVGEFQIMPIPLSHDSGITLGYILNTEKEKLVYITDTGYLKTDYYPLIENADYYVLESNHDIKMLMESKRPYPLKKRIISDNGHLDNESCSEILINVVGSRTKEVILAHLSEEANTPELALNSANSKLKGKEIAVRAAQQFRIIEGGQ